MIFPKYFLGVIMNGNINGFFLVVSFCLGTKMNIYLSILEIAYFVTK